MTDVLIIGSGGAGLVAAISAKESGASVKVVGKSFPTRSQTSMAQGGINAVMANVKEDSVRAHIADTMKSAQGLADESSVKRLCEEAIASIEWLDRIGLPFSRTKEGKIAQRQLGGASSIRACYAQDYTGLKILHTLYDQACKMGIEFINEYFLLNLIIEDESVSGATFLDIKTGEIKQLEAKSVIIATGGYSRIYNSFSTNSTSATGDGLAVALRAGAKLSDLEFVQFHPTGLKNSSILISESARGAGGHLLNAQKQRFTDELAPRDILARAIEEEIQKGGEVYLDIRHLGEAFIDKELPQERKLAIAYEGVDPVVDIIPIKPVAHYTMGGIDVNEDTMSCINGLFVAGESANNKIHGANRLGGNSLLELVVFGRHAGERAATYSKSSSTICRNTQQFQDDTQALKKIKNYTSEQNFYAKKEYLGSAFYTKAGIKRNEEDLSSLLAEVQEIKKNLSLMGPSDKTKIYNTNLTEFLEFSNVLEISEVLLVGALARKESRGAHFREDMPNKDDENFKAHTLISKNKGSLCVEFTN
ncbi:FAD-binding protein [Sulfurimonas sp. MAG313]|nr:FAD-dependent oxidoreductase [Sulfurimonas sp. MAG313]MDF1880387.1 FAD-binding protein [Sulfurimonas sp. MAG313]